MKICNKNILITGGAKGIGRSVVTSLACQENNILFTYNTSKDEAFKLADSLSEFNVQSFHCDLKDEAQVISLFDYFHKTIGDIDILINIAGVAKFGLLIDSITADYDYIFDNNVKSTYLTCKGALKDMVKNKRGNIVNVSSIWGKYGASCEALYSASKGAIIALTKALAKEYGPSNIRVNCVAPGCIKTDMLSEFSPSDIKSLSQMSSLNKIGSTNDVANAIYFLASDDSSFINGETIEISGMMC